MSTQDLAKLVTNALAAVAIVLFVLLASMPWEFGAIALVALFTPSALPTVIDGFRALRSSDKSPPQGPSVMGILVLVMGLEAVGAVVACSEAKTPREQARAVVLTIADGVRKGDEACAAIALAQEDLSLAETCAAIVSEARELLLAAEDGVDAWDAAAVENLPCATRSAADALARLLETIRRAGGKTPAAADDALRYAPVLAGACRGA